MQQMMHTMQHMMYGKQQTMQQMMHTVQQVMHGMQLLLYTILSYNVTSCPSDNLMMFS